MKEELVKQMDIDLQRVSDYDIETDEELAFGPCVSIHYGEMAKKLIDMGWTKIVWHKVADGDLPKNDTVVLAFYKPGYYGTKLYLKNADREGWWYGTSKCKTEDIIAWTELPAYEEN